MVEIMVRDEAVERAAAERATGTVHSRWQAAEPVTDYARAAQLGTPRITGLRESETSPPIPFAAPGGGVEAVMIGSADAAGPVELSAGEIEVVAAVEARFEAERDQPGG